MLMHLVVYIFFMIAVVLAGRFVADKADLNIKSASVKYGVSYFLGIGLLLVLVRIVEYLLRDARSATILSSVFVGILGACSCKRVLADLSGVKNKINLVKITGGISILYFFLFLVWNLPGSDAENPYASVGSLHSVRYAWISNFIVENNFIPILQQNIGQSLLAYVLGEIYRPAPFLYLFLWLCSSIVFLSIFIYGLLFEVLKDSKSAALGSLVFMVGQTAFSVTHVLTIDSGSPFFLNGYTDTIIGVFSILFLFVWDRSLRGGSSQYRVAFAVIVVVLLNFLSAPQNIIYYVVLFFILLFGYLFKRKPFFGKIVFLGAVIGLCFVFMYPLGGMFTPKYLLTNISYPGVMSVDRGVGRIGISILPGIPFHYGWFGLWQYGINDFLSFAKGVSSPFSDVNFLNKVIWNLEQIALMSIRIHVFPIIGLVYLIWYRGKSDLVVGDDGSILSRRMVKNIGAFGVAFFTIGFLMVFSISLNGYKWELSRFLIPGISLGMFGFAVAAADLKIDGRRFFRACLLMLLTFSLLGPIVNASLMAGRSAFLLAQSDNLRRQLDLFQSKGPVVLKSTCQDSRCNLEAFLQNPPPINVAGEPR